MQDEETDHVNKLVKQNSHLLHPNFVNELEEVRLFSPQPVILGGKQQKYRKKKFASSSGSSRGRIKISKSKQSLTPVGRSIFKFDEGGKKYKKWLVINEGKADIEK